MPLEQRASQDLSRVIGFWGGRLLDGWLGTTPWLSVVGCFFGLAAGIVNVYRVMRLAGPSGKPRS